MKNSTINYGKIITIARNSKHLTQQQLGERIGLGKTTICNYETNYSAPSINVFGQIADALGYSIIDMLYLDQNSEDTKTLQFPRAVQPGSDVYIPYLTSKSMKSGFYNKENFMDYYLTVPGFMIGDPKAKYICTKMPDASMTGDGICKNDYIIVRKSSFIPDKCIAVVSRQIDGEIFIRRYYRDGHIIALIPSTDSEEYSIIRTDERNNEYKAIGFVEKFLTNAHWM